MVRRILLLSLLVSGVAYAGDLLVFESGKRMRIESYDVQGDRINVRINDRSEMTIPLEWVHEIRVLPDPLLPVAVVPAVNQLSTGFAYAEVVQATAKLHEVDWKLVAAVMKVESNYNSQAVSRKGAVGLMQLMPDTADLYNVNPYDPAQNIDGGVRHLKMLLQRYGGKLDLVLAAYNAGAKAVDHYRGMPPFDETREYVKRVLQLYRNSSG